MIESKLNWQCPLSLKPGVQEAGPNRFRAKKSNPHFKPRCGENDKSKDLIVDKVKGKVKRENATSGIFLNIAFGQDVKERVAPDQCFEGEHYLPFW